jgi:hypothetical protein
MALEVSKGIVRLEAGMTPAEELGFRPRALVLWWCREPSAGCAGGIGFATDGGGAASAAWAADDDLTPSGSSRFGAEAPLLFHEDPEAPEASLRGHVRFADNGFSFECEREPEHAWPVHYLALGGPDLRGAAVRSLVLDRTGTRTVPGIGFTPDVVLAAAGGGSTAGEPQSGLAVAFGAADPSQQVTGGFVAQTDAGETVIRGAQCTEALVVLPATTASGDTAARSRVVSFDPDGFTLETSHLASDLPLAVLALAGGNCAVGLGSASSRSTRVGFEPAGALLFGTGLTAVSRSRDFGRLCMGGFSGDRHAGCVSWSARTRPSGPRSRSTSEAPFEVMDTTSGELHARATLSALGRRQFSLDWVRDRPAPRDFGYAVFGPELRKPTLGERLRLLGRRGALRE